METVKEAIENYKVTPNGIAQNLIRKINENIDDLYSKNESVFRRKAVDEAEEATLGQTGKNLQKFERGWKSRLLIQLGCGILGQLAGTFANPAVLSAEGAFDVPDVSVHLPGEGKYMHIIVFNKGVRRS